MYQVPLFVKHRHLARMSHAAGSRRSSMVEQWIPPPFLCSSWYGIRMTSSAAPLEQLGRPRRVVGHDDAAGPNGHAS